MNQDIAEHLKRAEISINGLFTITQRIRAERDIKPIDIQSWFFQRMYSYQRMNSALLRGLEGFSVSYPLNLGVLEVSRAGFYETQLQMYLNTLVEKYSDFQEVLGHEMDIIRGHESFVNDLLRSLQDDSGLFDLPYIPEGASLEFEEDDLFLIRSVFLNRYALRLFDTQLRSWELGSLQGLLQIWDFPDLDRLLKDLIQRSPEILAYASYLSKEFAYQWNISSLNIPQDISNSRQNFMNLAKAVLDSFSVSYTSPRPPWENASFQGI